MNLYRKACIIYIWLIYTCSGMAVGESVGFAALCCVTIDEPGVAYSLRSCRGLSCYIVLTSWNGLCSSMLTILKHWLSYTVSLAQCKVLEDA